MRKTNQRLGLPGAAILSRWQMFLMGFLMSFKALTGRGADGTVNVRQFQAKGDGQTLDTMAINRAIAACAASGGGQIVFPPGSYLTGTVELQSRITLVFEPGATLVGTRNLSEYKSLTPAAGSPEARFQPSWHRALLLGDGLEDVTIIGGGVLDGNKVFDPQGEERMRGPHTILLGNSRNITIRDVSIRDSSNYAILLEGCDHVEVRNVKITGGWDGVHFRGRPSHPCRDVQIVNCQFYTGDDAIAGRYWENTLISGCIINSSCNGIRLIGPAQHLIIHDCLFYGPGMHPHRTGNRHNMLAGICLQPGAWDHTEGLMDDIQISNITMRHVSTPFFFTTKPGNTAGRIEVDRVSASGIYRAAASIESWAESPFTNVVFRDVTLAFAGGASAKQAQPTVTSPGVDARPLPAWAFYARHVQNLALDQVRACIEPEDDRPVLCAEKVASIDLNKFEYPTNHSGRIPLLFTNVDLVKIDGKKQSSIATKQLP